MFTELHSVGCWLIGGPDEMPGQTLFTKLDSVLCVQDASERLYVIL